MAVWWLGRGSGGSSGGGSGGGGGNGSGGGSGGIAAAATADAATVFLLYSQPSPTLLCQCADESSPLHMVILATKTPVP